MVGTTVSLSATINGPYIGLWWDQLTGPTSIYVFSDHRSPSPSFRAPLFASEAERKIVFRVTVTDGRSVVSDLVVISLDPAFRDNNNGTALHIPSGMVWQKAVNVGRTWNNARLFCASNAAGLAGTSWRLPTKEDYLQITEPSSVTGLDSNHFPDAFPYLWTSTFDHSAVTGTIMYNYYLLFEPLGKNHINWLPYRENFAYQFRCVR